MAYKHILAVPIMNRQVTEKTRENYLEKLRKIGAERIWLAAERDLLFRDDREADLALIRENMAFFEKAGLEVGLWIQTLGFGDPFNARSQVAKEWTQLRSVDGKEIGGDAFCPEDPAFSERYCDWIKVLAGLHPKLIMLDDDHCLSVRPGLGCFCKYHMRLLEEELGEKLEEDGLAEKFFTGKTNKYRSAWLKVMRGTHLRFNRKIRAAADSVDPSIRIGLSSGCSSWDIEGSDAMEVSRTLAGPNTRPFLRLTGAPYWAAVDLLRFPGQKLNTIIEICRAQEAWCRGSDIEIFDENDSYPRPTYHVPASLCEDLDLALRANGHIGSLKYVLDYYASPDREPGYIKNHLRNMPFYDWIREHLAEKKAAGVRLYHPMRTVEKATLPDKFYGATDVMNRFFSGAAALLTQHSIPVSYEGDHEGDTGIAFGEDVLSLEKLPKKLIIDLPAAIALMDKGVDVGIESYEDGFRPNMEYYPERNEKIFLNLVNAARLAPAEFKNCRLKDSTRVLSEFALEDKRMPATYRYASGETAFMVLLFDGQLVNQSSSIFRSYELGEDLRDFIGGDFPYIPHAPQLYALYKKDEKARAVLFENLAPDMLFDFDVVLPEEASTFALYGAEGYLTEDKKHIHITSDIMPYGAFGLILYD